MKQFVYVIFLGATSLFSGCDSLRIMEENIDFDQGIWDVDNKPGFIFEVSDLQEKYNIYFNVRNTVNYNYHNLYITYYLLSEEGEQLASDLKEVFLFHPKTGKPYGSGLGDIFEHQFILLENQQFSKPGRYRLIIEQYMRVDSLTDILSVGVRAEKIAR